MTDPRDDKILRLSDGRRLAYAEYGDVDGTPVFVFHGNPGSRLSWGLLPVSPIRPGLRIIAPDRPGFGRSDFQAGRTLLDWPDDVAALADQLGLDRFAVAGASGGGPYVLACAWKMPERLTAAGVVSSLCPPDVPGVTQGMSRTNRLIFFVARHVPWLNRLNMNYLAALVHRNPDKFIKRIVFKMADVDKAIITRPNVHEFFSRDFPEALQQGGHGAAHELTIEAKPWLFPLEEIKMPVHLWHGELDPSVPPAMGRYLAKVLPHCHPTFIPNAGHLWVLDHMADVLDTLVPLGPMP